MRNVVWRQFAKNLQNEQLTNTTMAMTKPLWARRQLYHSAVSRIYNNGYVSSIELRAMMPQGKSYEEDYSRHVNEWMTDNIGKQWFKRSETRYDEELNCWVPWYVLNIECEAANEPYPPMMAIMKDINQYFSQF